MAGLHRTEDVEYHGREGRENRKRVPWRTDEQNAHAASAEILLKSQTLIHGDERIVLRIGRVKQGAVVEIRPPSLVDSLYAVPRQ